MNRAQGKVCKDVGRRVFSAFLSLVLAFSMMGVPVSAFAEVEDQGQTASDDNLYGPGIEGAVCLNDVWTDLTKAYTISTAGTYYLKADIETAFTATNITKALTVSAADATIYLNGFSLKVALKQGGSSAGGADAVEIARTCTSFKMIGKDKSGVKNGAVEVVNDSVSANTGMSAIASNQVAQAISIDGVDLSNKAGKTAGGKPVAGFNLANTTTAGNLTMKDCSVAIDYSSIATTKSGTVAYGIYTTSRPAASNVSVENCRFDVKTAGAAAATMTTGAKAYGIYQAQTVGSGQYSGLSVKGGSYAISSNGDAAYGLYLDAGTVSGDTTFDVKGSTAAYAINSNGLTTRAPLDDSFVTLDGKITASVAATNADGSAAVLHSANKANKAGNALFRIGSSFSAAAALSVLFGTTEPWGATIASWASGYTPDATALATLGESFISGYSEDVGAGVAVDATGAKFSAVEAAADKAAAQVTYSDSSVKNYQSIAAALSLAANNSGSTLKVLKDFSTGIQMPTVADSSAMTFTLDLNGHNLPWITNGTPKVSSSGVTGVSGGYLGTMTITDTNTVTPGKIDSLTCLDPATSSANSRLWTSVGNFSVGTIVLDGVSVDVAYTEGKAITGAVYSYTGGLVLKDTQGVKPEVSVTYNSAATGSDAYAVAVGSGAKLDISGYTVTLNKQANNSVIAAVGILNGDYAEKPVTIHDGASLVVNGNGSTVAGVYKQSTTKNVPFTFSGSTVSVTGEASSSLSGLFLLAQSGSQGMNSITGAGKEDAADITVHDTGSSEMVNGIYQNGLSQNSVFLTDVNISLETSCESTNLVYQGGKETLSLAGKFYASGSNNFTLGSQALTLASDLVFPESFVAQVSNSDALTDNVYAVAAVDGADLSSFASKFAASNVASNKYAGFTSQVLNAGTAQADNSKLEWYSTPVASLNGKNYTFLDVALNAMSSSSDVVKLLEDVTIESKNGGGVLSSAVAGLTISHSGKLDLSGHSVTVDMRQGNAAGQNQFGVMVVPPNNSSAVDFTIANSVGSGSFNVQMAAAAVSLYGFTIATNGSALDKQTKLTIDGAAVNVAQNGTSESIRVPANRGDSARLYGFDLNAKSNTDNANVALDIVNGAKVSVDSKAAGSQYGAKAVTGISQTVPYGSFNLDKTSTLEVKHSTEMSAATTSSNTLYLGQIELEPGTPTYDAVQKAFVEQAKWDSQARRFYAMPLVLDDGRSYYAFSDKLAADVDETDASNIVATEFWASQSFKNAGEAVGVSFLRYSYNNNSKKTGLISSYLQGTLSVQGETADRYGVKVATTNAGNPVGAYAARIVLDGATLNVGSNVQGQAANVDTGTADFADIYGLSDSKEFHLIASQGAASYGYYSTLDLIDSTAAVPVSPLVDIKDGTQINTYGGTAVDIASKAQVGLSLSDSEALSDANGDALTVLDPSSADGNVEGASFARAFSSDETVSAANAVSFADPNGELGAVLGSDGTLQWGKNTHTVQFIACDKVLVNKTLKYGTQISLPDSDHTAYAGAAEDGCTYEFLGWSTDKTRTADDFGADGDIPATASNFVVEETCTYYAIYKKVVDEVTVTFTGMFDENGSPLSNVTFTTEYGTTLGDALKAQGKGDVLTSGAKDYSTSTSSVRFIGWKQSFGSWTWAAKAGTGDDITLKRDETFTAQYATVGTGSHIVKFYDQNSIVSYSVIDSTKTLEVSDTSSIARGAYGDTFKNATVAGLVNGYKGTGGSTYTTDEALDYKAADNRIVGLPNTGTSADQEFTVVYKETATTNCSLTVNRWTVNDQGEYSYAPTTITELAYGSDPIQEANARVTPTQFVMNGKVYTFLGWSSRQGDTKPVSGWEKDGSLPAMGSAGINTATYVGGGGSKYGYTVYAIYSEQDISGNVEFMAPGEDGSYAKCATAESMGAAVSIDSAFATTGADAPVTAHKRFIGWSLEEGAESVGVSSTIGELVTEAFAAGDASASATGMTFTVYAVFEAVPTYDVVFYVDPTDESVTWTVEDVEQGEPVASAGEDKLPKDSVKAGSFFTGWVTKDAQGVETAFDVETTPITAYTEVYPTFKEITVSGKTGSSDATVGLGYLDVSSAGLSQATGINASVTKQASADLNLTGRTNTGGAKLIGSYLANITASFADDSTVVINENFGYLQVTVPVSGGSSYSAYWLDSAGKVKSTTNIKAVGGKITFYIDSYNNTMFGGNIAVYAYGATNGTKVTSGDVVYQVSGASTAKVVGVSAKGKKAKTLTVAPSVKVNGKTYTVTAIASKAFKSAKKLKTLNIKATKLAKKSVKGSLKGAKKLKKVKVAKSKLKAYKKIFTKKNAGKKVKVSKL